MAAASVLFICVGGLLAYLASVAGTCTMGDAGHLGMIIVAIPFQALGVAFAAKVSRGRTMLIVWVITLPVLGWQAIFGLHLAFNLLILDTSACEALMGLPHDNDGDERYYALLWLSVGLIVPLAMTLLAYRRFRLAPTEGIR